MIEKHSGLPMSVNEETGELEFHSGLLCEGSSMKKLGQMTGLFKDVRGIEEDRLVYRAYRDIRFRKDEDLFRKWDYRYDVTVVMPGDLNGEFYKTSGHFHGCPPLAKYPFPEVYEVIKGEIVFVLQRNADFGRPDGGKITQLQAVRVKAGQAIIVPSHCGHGSINPTGGVSAFSNIAVVSCPIDYEPVKKHHGLAARIMKEEGNTIGFKAAANNDYGELPEIELAEPLENARLGIEFGVPCYCNFIRHPERYDFLLHPDSYIDEIDKMTKVI